LIDFSNIVGPWFIWDILPLSSDVLLLKKTLQNSEREVFSIIRVLSIIEKTLKDLVKEYYALTNKIWDFENNFENK